MSVRLLVERKPSMTNDDAAKKYQEIALKLSYLYHQINDLHDTAEFITEQTHDNGDPEYALEKGLWWLGQAVATATTYADEYREDAEKAPKEKKSGTAEGKDTDPR
jgi:hypothetical protein